VATLTALGLGASSASVYAGLWGYSAVLSSIAVGGMFFVANSLSCFFYTILAAAFSAVIHAAVVSYMAPFGLPALTFPFNCVAWIWCLAGNSMAGLLPVEITAITIPEDHIKRVQRVQKMTSKFREL
jgi:urea transporter